MKKHTIVTYEFDELSDEAKRRALEVYRNINVDYDGWCDFVYEDAKRMGEIIGIDIENIYFSGFAHQDQGAMFEGRYEYVPGSMARIREEAPLDYKLHEIADRLDQVQTYASYQIVARTRHSYPHYYHEYTMQVDVEREDEYDLREGQEEEVIDCLREFARWIYRQLDESYFDLIEDEQVAETIRANEYEFTESGRRFLCEV